MILAMTAAVGSTEAGVTYHHTRSHCLCDLPDYKYVYGELSQPVSVFSLAPLAFEPRQPPGPGAPPGLVRERIRYFQLSLPAVQLEHCALSNVSVALYENGAYTLSMRGHQNAWMTGPDNVVSTPVHLFGAVSSLRPPIPNLARETEGLKRNQFFVRVRCYGGYPLRDSLPALAPAKPVLFELPLACFWVQRGHPYDFFAHQPLPAAAQYFDLVDRVEVEFSFH
jgi:hypothetical protein